MAVFERQTTVNSPVAEVFSYLADLPRHAEWAAHRLSIQQTSEGPVGLGTTFACVGHMMGQDHADQVTITEFVPNSRIAFESIGDAGRWRHYIQLQEESGGTRLTKGSEILEPSLMTRLLAPIAKMFVIPAALAGDLRRIKAKLEGGSA